jgi:ABC-type glycerol-3-phosphate transport system permease component
MPWRSMRVRAAFLRAFSYTALLVGGCLVVLPFFWMISTALKYKMDVYLYPPVWIPWPMHFENFADGLTAYPFGRYFVNSFFISISVALGTLASCSLAGYGFARLRFPGRNVIFIALLATTMLPSVATLIPLFIMFQRMGWLNTYKPLIVPSFFGNAFYIFLMRQFFMGIPRELADAAKMDGCSSLGIYARVIMPLSKPVIATVTIFTFMDTWNDFMGPLIYLNNPLQRTVALGLAYFSMTKIGPLLSILMAVSLVAVLPTVLLFFFAQRLFIQGIVFTGVKG